jgi:transketolase
MIDVKDFHQSQRGYFAGYLYNEMEKNPDIYLLVGDLGYGAFDRHFKDFPNRCINTGASEQALVGMAVGLALEGKKPFVYSITPFLLYRPFEWIRNYINHEKIPVRLIGAGRDRDYLDDGFSHWSEEADDVLGLFRNIRTLHPKKKENIKAMFKMMVEENNPWFISLKR